MDVKVITPTKLTERQIELLREFEELSQKPDSLFDQAAQKVKKKFAKAKKNMGL